MLYLWGRISYLAFYIWKDIAGKQEMSVMEKGN
jgi:hypothetical protein